MPTYRFVVLANPVEGKEEEFNRFYSDRHLADVLKVPGVKSAQRFRLTEAQRQPAPSPFRYLAIYEIETDDLAALAAEIARRSGTPEMPRNDFIAQHPKFAYFFEPIGPVLVADA